MSVAAKLDREIVGLGGRRKRERERETVNPLINSV